MPDLPLPTILWSLFGIALLVWIGMTAVLVYHWNAYAKGDAKVRRMKRVHFVGSLVMFVSALSFIFSL